MVPPMARRTLWIGTYPSSGVATSTGGGEGIWRVELDPSTGTLSEARQVATTPAPSFLAWSRTGDLLYAVNEEVEGHLTAWRPAAGSLEWAGTSSTGGSHPCHLHIDRASRTALVANYTSGSLAVIRLDAEGVPAATEPQQLFRFDGRGPHPVRQRGPHAHYVLPCPVGGHVLVTDLGTDLVRRFRVDRDGHRLIPDGIAAHLPPGAGPRHAVFSPDGRWLYVLGELDGRLHTLAWDADSASGRLTSSAPAQPDASQEAYPAHLVLEQGQLQIGVRGVDLIATHRIDGDGTPAPTGSVDLPGSWPRHHTIVDGWLVVALQKGGGVVAMDPCGEVAGAAPIPSPACILPTPGPLTPRAGH